MALRSAYVTPLAFIGRSKDPQEPCTNVTNYVAECIDYPLPSRYYEGVF